MQVAGGASETAARQCMISHRAAGEFSGMARLRFTHRNVRGSVFGRDANAPSPEWERASGLGAGGSLRPRRLGQKGEGLELRAETVTETCTGQTSRPSPSL